MTTRAQEAIAAATARRAAARAAHECCYHVAAAKAVLTDRERELLELKGPCSTNGCRLHRAHSGPCDIRPPAEHQARLAAEQEIS